MLQLDFLNEIPGAENEVFKIESIEETSNEFIITLIQKQNLDLKTEILLNKELDENWGGYKLVENNFNAKVYLFDFNLTDLNSFMAGIESLFS